MAGSVNKVILIGNLGRDPEIRSMQNGGRVCNLSVATSESWTDKQSGERREVLYERGVRPDLLVGGFMVAAAGLSMWISNTATAAMLFPIGMSIAAHLARTSRDNAAGVRRFSLALMLITSFAASVGGLATPIGTPPNLIAIGMLDRLAGIHISFFKWMTIGVPIVVDGSIWGFLGAAAWLRRSFAACGTSSVQRAASVPGRGEYLKMKAPS